jgi:DNA-binding NtrC family response regulator
MDILVIDQGPELFWFVSLAMSRYELQLRHVQNIQSAQQCIQLESPKVVVMSGDDSTLAIEHFIPKIRNDIFAMNTLFIVITANASLDYKKLLLKAGASQILYRNKENIL